MRMKLPEDGVRELRSLTGNPEIGALPLPKQRGRPRGAISKKEKPAKKAQLNWDALSPLVQAGFTEAQMAKAVGMPPGRFRSLFAIACTDGKFDPEKAKLLSTASVANALFNAGANGSMPANWVLAKALKPETYFDRMPADPGKKIEKLSDDELEQLLLKNPALRKKALEVESKSN